MNRVTAALAAALIASAGLNVYLGWIRDSGSAASVLEPAPSAPPPAITPPSDRVAIGSLAGDKGCEVTLASCLETRASLEGELDKTLPPMRRFELSEGRPGDPALEGRFGRELSRVLADVDHSLECRGDVCRIEIVTGENDEPTWMEKVQHDREIRALASRMTFVAPRPTTDPVSGKGLLAHQFFVGLKERDAVSGMEILEGLIAELERSGAIERCAREHPDDAGTLTYRLRIDGDRTRIGIDLGGDLYATAAGRCIGEAQAQIAAAETLPDNVSRAMKYHHIRLPLESRRTIDGRSIRASAVSR